MSKCGKLIILAAVGVILLPVLIGVAYIVRIAGTGKQLDRKLAEIKARGEPVSASELIDSSIPDNENAATLYAPIIKEINKPGSNRDFDLLADFAGSEKRMSVQPTEGQIRAILARYSSLLQRARLAAAMPKCRFKLILDDELVIDSPHLTALKRLALLARVEAKLDTEAGKTDEAAELVLLQTNLAESLKNDPGFISQAYRYRIHRNACDLLEDTLCKGPISKSTARALESRLKQVNFARSLSRAALDERAIGISYYEQARRGNFGAFTDAGTRRQIRRLTSNPIVGNMLDKDELYYLNEMESLLEVIDLPYRESLWRKPQDSETPRFNVISSSLLTMPQSAHQYRDVAVAQIASARIALALDQHKQDSGSYPASLGELSYMKNWKAPLDPFSGKSLIYKRKGSGYILYSVGTDNKDNGGKDLGTSKPKAISYKEEHDIVWAVER